MIPASVRYARAADVAHALELLVEPDAKVLAGGQSLLPVMKLRIARPSLVVDVSRLPLRGVELHDDRLHLGALTTWDELATASELRRPALAAIGECALGIGDLQVRNRGTLGGSVAHADPASDMPAVLIALGARLSLRSQLGERSVPVSEFFLGAFLTVLEPGELVIEIELPLPPAGSGSAYVSVEHPASGFALAGAAALVGSGGEASIALTGLAARPFLVTEGRLDADLAQAEVFGDRFAPAEYRRALGLVVARRAVEAARERARNDHR